MSNAGEVLNEVFVGLGGGAVGRVSGNKEANKKVSNVFSN